MALRDIIVIGGSMGSTEVLLRTLRDIPEHSLGSYFISTHLAAGVESNLAGVLGTHCALPVSQAADEEAIQPGRVYVAAPNRHLLLTADGVKLGGGPRENMARPAIDAMFRSAALAYGPRVVGVVLSGMLNDGAAGLAAIKQCGGLAVVQEPTDAIAPDMPKSALAVVEADHVVASDDIGRLLAELATSDAGPPRPCPDELRLEVEVASGVRLGSQSLRKLADPVPLTCPQCDGVLSEVRGARPLRYRCQIGHAVTAKTLFETQDLQIEEALRVAMRIMEERVELVTRLAQEARAQGRTVVADLYEGRSKEYRGYAETLRAAALLSLKVEAEGDGVS